uniref:Uncharacterized protein n=1 Tax=Chromera velia CCMP2878 TaxID=1169474 RepID=A0A0G4HKW5_9ALVE|mmetsp:Transcript_10208/g.19784  ORF Transcript_10208/g.19784 Transcript_10208/m.19784 type:complete len:317 (+) Transcript_10208:116-1066(+)|eukprot:Cvel_28539.t1-p1 / transcript=Cvel_28539.t1 / gene=Cvel_28539 / organism=Chromera_velia_CCMP2878 / gene_product=Protein lifeguard 3, putative / transcript_product=Protein lifeguard 3, putative / location=Cvel_scaffold3758:942-3767(+) / protein_length=316 / sequence_SO=supercontig / SO=protein_coding / is_pseudo=false
MSRPNDIEQGGYGGPPNYNDQYGGNAYGGQGRPQGGNTTVVVVQDSRPQPSAYGQPYGATDKPYVQPYPPAAHQPPVDYSQYEGAQLDGSVPTYVRHAFIRKVYTILGIQLAITFAICCIFMFVQPVKTWMAANVWFFIVVLIVSFVILCMLTCCCTNLARHHPWNMILLGIFTLCFAAMLGVIIAFADVNAVGIAALATAVIVVGLTAFACQTKYDFTGWGPYLFVALLMLLVFGLLAGIFVPTGGASIVGLVIAVLGATIFSLYIVYDTQLIVGGKHRKYQLGVDEYVFGALSLYLDITQLFLCLLSIVGFVGR